MKQCAQCGQWLNLEVNYYVVATTSHGRRHFLHHRTCAERFAEIHQIRVEHEVLGCETHLHGAASYVA
jgi:hypothetical protein